VSREPEAYWPAFERVGAEAFRGHQGKLPWAPFDAVAADMDLDGDTDLLINWHHRLRLELFGNQGGMFQLLNPRDDDVSGLYDNPGIPTLFAPYEETLRRVRRLNQPGLFLWHDDDRNNPWWHFVWRNDPRRLRELRLELETSIGFDEVRGVSEGERTSPDSRKINIRFAATPGERRFDVHTWIVCTELVVRLDGGSATGTPSLFVGADLVPRPGPELSLWTPDPHGIAWLDVEGSRRPDLYITRGGVMGRLKPPANPKTDRFLIASEDPAELYHFGRPDPSRTSFGRGRRVEWVDVDNDGSPELSISNYHTPNSLLFLDPAKRTRTDRAGEYGVDYQGADVQAWADYDLDGRQDLFFLDGNRVNIALNRGGAAFKKVQGETVGLRVNNGQAGPGLFARTVIRFADFDNDGDLDLWVLGVGPRATSQLFRREPHQYTDVTEEVGLTQTAGHALVVLLDVDNDSYEDAVSFGTQNLLWKNVRGERFEFHQLHETLVPESIKAAVVLDADNDGRTDLIALGQMRHLLRNISDAGHTHLDVVLQDRGRDAIGALVYAEYEDGRVATRRYGSAHNTIFSQSILPLRFGVRRGNRLARIAVRWPGSADKRFYAVAHRDGETMVIKR
jgi:hypothetical protein